PVEDVEIDEGAVGGRWSRSDVEVDVVSCLLQCSPVLCRDDTATEHENSQLLPLPPAVRRKSVCSPPSLFWSGLSTKTKRISGMPTPDRGKREKRCQSRLRSTPPPLAVCGRMPLRIVAGYSPRRRSCSPSEDSTCR